VILISYRLGSSSSNRVMACLVLPGLAQLLSDSVKVTEFSGQSQVENY